MSLVTDRPGHPASGRRGPAAPRLRGACPATHLLGNGRYSVWLTEAGMGRSSWGREALTRWAGDRVEDADGWRFWLRDLDLGRTWPVTPTRAPARGAFSSEPGLLAWTRRDHGIEAQLEVCVAADCDAELRTITVRNHTDRARRLDVTGCVELVLHDPAADASHPAFSKLFVQTAWDAARGALTGSRRPRSPEERHAVVAHALVGEGALEWETDRAQFLGRGRSASRPAALATRRPLTGTVGNVLDPVFALRRGLTLGPGATCRWTFLLAAGETPAAVLSTLDALASTEAIDAARGEAGLAARQRLERAGLTAEDALVADELAGALLYGNPALRAPEDVLRAADDDAAVRAALGIGRGTNVIVVRFDEPGAAETWERLRRALGHWRHHGIDVALAATGGGPERLEPETGVVMAGALDRAARRALEAGAAIVARDVTHAPLRSPAPADPEPDGAVVAGPEAGARPATRPLRRRGPRRDRAALAFANGYGGFAPGGREYVVHVDPLRRGSHGNGPGSGHRLPPLPWVNVIANPRFGTLVSETGAGFTWSGNSREHRLTPWSNDPLLDPHGEALFVEDLASGAAWSPTPGPLPHPAAYEVRHGLGASTFHLEAESLEHETRVAVDAEAPVKHVRVRITNRDAVQRELSLVAFAALVMGATASAGHRVVTEHEARSGALLARNPAAGDWRDAVAFARVVTAPGATVTWTTDRRAFVGAGGELARPRALGAPGVFDGATGAMHDACFAWRVSFVLAPGETRELAFVMGEGADGVEARELIERFATPHAVEASARVACERWDERVSRLRIETPAPELDLMVNGWLPYQTLSCRLWGRSAFYQSGGAFGFRDQLQDALGLLMLEPELAREQILLNARHQFVEGDVLHWWHPAPDASGPGIARGMRTRFADDLLWLPYLTATYVHATGDEDVLDAMEGFVIARALAPGEDEAYLAPERTATSASIYEHSARAIERSLRVGAHGLPLFGCGDWNDGMNRVGREGRGESVWMGWFVGCLLADWAAFAEARGERDRAARWRAHRGALAAALEREAWDGEWYRRGWYDDGAPLGSRASDECRIDALAQAWSVISGLAPRARAEQAMGSLEKHLVSEPERLIRLLAPPFKDTPHDPGYIKGYVAGVRENGGQYTHAALWVVRAFAELGRRDLAARLLTMLSPVSHARDTEHASRYKTEPYVVAADVYGVAPHVGRGGWTWYTGSSGWMYRVALESVLGVTLERGRVLVVRPCIPDEWPGYSLTWRPPDREDMLVEIVVRNPHACSAAVVSATLDGAGLSVRDGSVRVPLPRDAQGTHRIDVELGPAGQR
ncbi:MAG TPA: glycosyl transferase [Methylomirabilota bacterium]|nr:glycosyl transferase [Methylomirabilota bacterium]